MWHSFVVALLLSCLSTLSGAWIAQRVGLLAASAPIGEVTGIGLSVGLVSLAAVWGAIASGGRSAFTPIALGIVAAVGISFRSSMASDHRGLRDKGPEANLRSALPFVLIGIAFVISAGLLYGLTMAPSPRAGVQPVEFMDEAYYSVLGERLAATGSESIYSPSGFEELPRLPEQTWYHWGEMWLSAAVIAVTGAEPLFARHYVVLPVMLLAAAALTGSLVRKLARNSTRGAFVFGAGAALFLAPVPLPGPYFAGWAQSLIFSMTMYGLGAIAAMLSLYVVAVHAERPHSWPMTLFLAVTLASMIPSHIVIAGLALLGFGSVVVFASIRHGLAYRKWPQIPDGLRPALVATAAIAILTIGWGVLTGHGIGTSGLSTSVDPFNESWRDSLARIAVGAGAFLCIPIAWWAVRRRDPLTAGFLAGTMFMLAVSAVIWGARLGDFTMFHVFFGGLAVFGAPAAAISVWLLWESLRAKGQARAAAVIMVACIIQFEIGAAAAVPRLLGFGPRDYEPIPVAILRAIKDLPADAKLVYACQPLEEIGFFWDPRLESITAHTGRPVVAMCYQAAFFDQLIGGEVSHTTMSPQFAVAPQRDLYPASHVQPSPAAMTRFLKLHGIDYIYVDAEHPNVLVPDAISISSVGEHHLLRIPDPAAMPQGAKDLPLGEESWWPT